MKKIMSSTVLLLFLSAMTWACPVCERNQPKMLKGITHGAGPESRWDYVIVGITAVIVLLTLFFSVKWILRPGEHSQKHIKREILNYL